MRRYVLVGLLLLVGAASASGQSTTFLGAGPTYTLPLDTFAVTNDNALGGTLLYESRKFCQIWFGVRLSYTANRVKEKTGEKIRLFYEDQIVLAPEARYFFAQPTSFPLYLVGNLQLSNIAGADSASRAGLGLAGGLGYLLEYDNDCCKWFLDFSAVYQAPNLLLRSSRRPTLSSILLALTFNISI